MAHEHDDKLEKLGTALRLDRITDKSALRQWVDELPDEVVGGILIIEHKCLHKACESDDDHTAYSVRLIGESDDRDALWLMQLTEKSMFEGFQQP